MDLVSIATAVVTFLIPFLVEGDKAAAKKGGEALVAALERRFKDKPAAQEALDDVKKNPQDEDFQAVLRVQLKKTLAADEEFLAELAQLLEQTKAATGAGIVAQDEGAVEEVAVGSSTFVGSDREIFGNSNVPPTLYHCPNHGDVLAQDVVWKRDGRPYCPECDAPLDGD